MAGPAKDPQADGKDRPLYEIVRDQLIGEIRSGAYPAGALLPSVREITVKWTVSTTTARKVLAELVAAGYARSEGTRGHVSEGASPATSPAATVGGPATGPAALDVRAHQTVPPDGALSGAAAALDVRREPAAAEVAQALGLRGPDPQVVVRRSLTADDHGAPVQLRVTYTLPDIAEGTPLAAPEPIDLPWPDAIAQHTGHRVHGIESHVAARHPVDSEAAALRLDPTACVLARTDLMRAEKGVPIAYAVSVWPGEGTRLTLREV